MAPRAHDDLPRQQAHQGKAMKRATSPHPDPASRKFDQGPVDADWPDHEQAARNAPSPPGDGKSDEGEVDTYGDPKDVQDEGVLESLGKAVSSPVRDKPEDQEANRDGEAKS
jgi:hypothetical protein